MPILERSHSSAASLVNAHLGAFIFSLNYLLERDKSFTRSDALAKPMRLQHNVSPYTDNAVESLRGGNTVTSSRKSARKGFKAMQMSHGIKPSQQVIISPRASLHVRASG